MFTVFAGSTLYTHTEVGARGINTSTTIQTDVLYITLIFICNNKIPKPKIEKQIIQKLCSLAKIPTIRQGY